MNSAEHKAVVRACVDDAWSAFEKALGEYLRDPVLTEELVATMRSLRMAERALIDGNVTPPADADFAETVKRARERLGR